MSDLGNHYRVILNDNTEHEGVLVDVGRSVLKFFNVDEALHFLVPMQSIKMMWVDEEGPEGGWGDEGYDEPEPEPDPDPEGGEAKDFPLIEVFVNGEKAAVFA